MNRRSFISLSPSFPVAAISASLTLREEGKPPIDLDVSVLKLEPGDTIVLTAPYLSLAAEDRVRAGVNNLFPDVKVMVLLDGMKVDGVLRGPA